MANYIFDFDGTIADNFALICDILQSHHLKLGSKKLESAEFEVIRNMHASDMLMYLEVSSSNKISFINSLQALCRSRHNEIKVFSDYMHILPKLKSNGHTIGIISSNSTDIIRLVLEVNQLNDFFDYVIGDQGLFSKADCLHELITNKNFKHIDTFYIGDELRDVEAAQKNNIKAVAVSWGKITCYSNFCFS